MQDTDLKNPPKDYLEDSIFNFALELFQRPNAWKDWQVILAGLGQVALVFIAWLLVTSELISSSIAALASLLYLFLDTWLIRALPKAHISFGPWKPQVLVLSLPRFVLASITPFLTPVVGTAWSIVIMALGQLTGSILLGYATVIEPHRLVMTHLNVKTDKLPRGSQAIRILHISDLHIERITGREKKLLKLVERAKADLILISGDYVNLSYRRDPETHREIRSLLAKLEAPHGVFATLGSPLVDLRDVIPPLFAELPIQLMKNEQKCIGLGNGRNITILGLDCSHNIPADSKQLDQLVASAPNRYPLVLLYHAPDLMDEAVDHGIDLYLCGHTHGGQVRLPGYGAILTSSQLGKRFEMGLYKNHRTHLYVSRGVGLEGLSAPRVRFLAPPEITLVTLRSTSH